MLTHCYDCQFASTSRICRFQVTVLHRCDRHVGSCNDGNHQCGPSHATEVKMPFKVTFLEEMAGRAKGDWEMEYHPLQNHTACECLKYDGPPPTKTAVHYHYIDPSLTPPQGFLPLDPSSQDTRGNASSYDVTVYSTQQPPRNESYQGSESPSITVPSISIYEMTKVAEVEVNPRPSEETCSSCDENQYSGDPGYNPISEPAVQEREPSTTHKAPQPDDFDDAAATVIPDTDVRFGAGHGPQSEALTDSDSPYDSYLRQAF